MRQTPLSRVMGIAIALTLTCVAPATALAEEQTADNQVAPVEAAAIEATVDSQADDAALPADEVGAIDEGQAVEQETPAVMGEEQPAEGELAPDAGEATTEVSEAQDGETGDGQPADAEDVTSVKEEQAPASNEVAGSTEAPAAKTATDAKGTALNAQATRSNSAQIALDKLAAKHASEIEAGRYAITTKADKANASDKTVYALDLRRSSKEEGASIILYAAGTSSNQRWDITYLSSGYALIKSACSGLYLALSNGANAFASGSPVLVQQKLVSGGEAWQRWIIIKQSDGSLKLISGLLKDGEVQCSLDVRGGKAKNGAEVIIYQARDTRDANQRFGFGVTADILDGEAKAHKGDLKDGIYVVGSSLNTTFVLNMRGGSKSDGTTATIWKGGPYLHEGWKITHNAAGYANIINVNSGKALDVRRSAAKNDTDIIQWAASTNGRNQQWIVSKESDGSYRFVSALAGDAYYVLSIKDGKAANSAQIVIQDDPTGAKKASRWKITAAPESFTYKDAIADGTYMIRTALDLTKVLEVPRSSTANNAQVKLYTANVSYKNQFWIVSHDNQGYVMFKNKNSGLYLNFSSTKVNGSIVTNQTSKVGRWILKPGANNSFVLKNADTSTCADLRRSNTANGAEVIAYAASGGKNQQWVVAKVAAIKVAIDPGHGANDSGAVGNGLRECDLTWVIANECAAQLRTYGFDVYMTMTQSEFKTTSKTTPSIQTRVTRAKNAGCTAIFSIHINAGGGSGAEVLVPNSSSFHKEFYTMGQKFAKDVTTRIKNAVGIGVHGDGALERNYSASETGGSNKYYTGGGYADYYGIVRYAREAGMFGVIIEHGFIDNAHDAAILKSSANLKKIGQADAAAIKALLA